MIATNVEIVISGVLAMCAVAILVGMLIDRRTAWRYKQEQRAKEKARKAKKQERAKRSEQRDLLQKRFDQIVRGRWERFSQSMADWQTSLTPIGCVPNEEMMSWFQRHAVLQLPVGTEPVQPFEFPVTASAETGFTGLGASCLKLEGWDKHVFSWRQGVQDSLLTLLDAQPLLDKATDAAGMEYPETRRLRDRLERFLRDALPLYDQAMIGWKAAFGRALYVSESDYVRWLHPHVSLPPPGEVSEVLPGEYKLVLEDLCRALNDARGRVAAWNDAFVKYELDTWRSFFDGFETYSLSQQQRQAIVHDEDNNLVIAGAGTGKTSTIVGKVGYLLQKGLASPDEVLLLAFTRKAAQELQERVERFCEIPPKVRTFHALGLEIVGKATGRKPALCREAEDEKAKRNLLESLAAELIATDASFAQNFMAFQGYHQAPYRSAWDFENAADYYAYLKSNATISLKGERLRSLEEVEIANFLTLNGVKYLYEVPYEVDTRTPSRRQYKPDFFLPDHGIYIEHFAVDESGRPPPWFPKADQQRYIEDTQWKRAVHLKYETTLIETYSWERRRGRLLDKLRRQLEQAGVPLQLVSHRELLQTLNAAGLIEPFYVLLAAFLSLFKSSGYTEQNLRDRTPEGPEKERFSAFVRLFAAIYEQYSALLTSRQEVDFDDMILLSTEHVSRGHYQSEFRYIIVDEFQDIAMGRANLLRSLRDQVDGCKLFCVGDDWQSIYRFTGSDLSLMTRFTEHFGKVRRMVLDETFRLSDKLAQFSSAFVLKNKAQIPKTLIAHKSDSTPPVIIHLIDGESDPLPQVLRDVAAQAGNKRASVLLLNRYRVQARDFEYKRSLSRNFPTLQVDFSTAHSAKGREADYVIVDNLRCGRRGFPTEIVDDPILSLVLAQPDACQHGEERRLFYVALTRSRNQVWLIADASQLSCFVEEIVTDDTYEKVIPLKSDHLPEKCPCCKGGRILERRSKDGLFFSCSNYPACTHTEETCPVCRKGRLKRNENLKAICVVCGHSERVCPSCRSGLLIGRDGPFGPFFGCSLFKAHLNSCSYTEMSDSRAGPRPGEQG